jgi:GAF domain-containing protein
MSAPAVDEPEGLGRVARDLVETQGVAPTHNAVVAKAATVLPCRWAAVAVAQFLTKRPARLTASTDADLAAKIAEIAGAAGASPGITAFESGKVVVCSDLAVSDEYRDYSNRMMSETPVRSVLSVPLQNADGPLGVLTCYADRSDVFDDRAIEAARTLGDLAVLAIEAALGEDKADNLQMALLRSRTIGAAIGILMERHRVNADDAFKLLGSVSQHTNTKLVEVAAELVDTGNLSDLPEDAESAVEHA